MHFKGSDDCLCNTPIRPRVSLSLCACLPNWYDAGSSSICLHFASYSPTYIYYCLPPAGLPVHYRNRGAVQNQPFFSVALPLPLSLSRQPYSSLPVPLKERHRLGIARVQWGTVVRDRPPPRAARRPRPPRVPAPGAAQEAAGPLGRVVLPRTPRRARLVDGEAVAELPRRAVEAPAVGERPRAEEPSQVLGGPSVQDEGPPARAPPIHLVVQRPLGSLGCATFCWSDCHRAWLVGDRYRHAGCLDPSWPRTPGPEFSLP